MKTKVCSSCKKRKLISKFYKGSGVDGYHCYCKQCSQKYVKEYFDNPRNRDKKLYKQSYTRLYRYRIKERIVKHYSNGTMKCKNCGISDIRCLCIDHINGRGDEERANIGRTSGSPFYKWLLDQHLPHGYQVLCANCNLIKELDERINRGRENR